MEQFFTKDYTGAPFELFGRAHLAALGLVVIVALSFIAARRLWDEAARRRFRYAMALWMLLWEISWHAWSIYYGTFTIQTNLPLHICSVFVWLTIIMMLNKNSTIYELAYFLGIGGALQTGLSLDEYLHGHCVLHQPRHRQ